MKIAFATTIPASALIFMMKNCFPEMSKPHADGQRSCPLFTVENATGYPYGSAVRTQKSPACNTRVNGKILGHSSEAATEMLSDFICCFFPCVKVAALPACYLL
jgi:hypothetical protein